MIVVEAEKPVLGNWDALRLDQAFGNLLNNALNYGRGKPIEVHVWQADGKAFVSVRDHGPGVAPEDRERIFGRFRRATASRGRGFGLGLWIVRRIATAFGGDVSVAAADGGGALFTLELPVQTPT